MDENIYAIDDVSTLASPSVIVFREIVERNIQQMIRIAGDVQRLRPHCKTHKIPEVVALQQAAGIQKFKCATLREAEMLALAGVKDIFVAYNLVGPNVPRVIGLAASWPDLRISVTVDHSGPLKALSTAAQKAGVQIEAVLDLDTGLGRTGVDPQSDDAVKLYQMISNAPGIRPGGLHWYDGQHHQRDPALRRGVIEERWQDCKALWQRLSKEMFVPRVVAGGTGAFPIYAAHDQPELELSPGTVVFHDAGYADAFPDLSFTPAALLLTRIISCPTPNRITLDAGSKAVASDPPLENRVRFPELPDAKIVMQNEEHLVVETINAKHLHPGDHLLAIPWHVCPTIALHDSVNVCEQRSISKQWRVAARSR